VPPASTCADDTAAAHQHCSILAERELSHLRHDFGAFESRTQFLCNRLNRSRNSSHQTKTHSSSEFPVILFGLPAWMPVQIVALSLLLLLLSLTAASLLCAYFHATATRTPGVRHFVLPRVKRYKLPLKETPRLGTEHMRVCNPAEWFRSCVVRCSSLLLLAMVLNALPVSAVQPGVTAEPTEAASPTPICQPSWAHYITDGSELSDSCLQVSDYFDAWAEASVGCPTGSHMWTLRSFAPTSSTGLHQFVIENVNGALNGWAGASQSSLATSMNREWAWIDGTNAANLNCGAANQIGCGVWTDGEPKYVCLAISAQFAVVAQLLSVPPCS
jgi:hypothetical protein